MGKIALRLPDSVHEEVRKLAERINISISQLATLAIAEKVAALKIEDCLMQRAARADKKKFLRVTAKVAGATPDVEDILQLWDVSMTNWEASRRKGAWNTVSAAPPSPRMSWIQAFRLTRQKERRIITAVA